MSGMRIQGGMSEIFEMYQPHTLAQSELKNDGPYLVYGANGVIGKHTSYNHEEAQVLVTCRGATCGAINVSAPFSWINGNAMVIKPRENNVDLAFLKYYLEFGIDIKKVITGAAQPQITRQSLSMLKVDLPPLAEQQCIAAILDKAKLIKLKRELAIEKLDRLAESVFYEMFGDPVANDKGWPMTTMACLAAKEKYSIVDGPFGSSMKSTDYRESGIPVIRIANVSKEGNFITKNLLYIDEAKFQDLKRSSIGPNDVLVTRVGTIGNTCVFPADIGKALLSTTGVCKIKPNEDLMLPTFLHKAIKTKSFQDQINRSASTSVQKYFNLSALKGWKIIVPSLDEQKVFLGRIKGIEEQLTKSKFSLQAMERTRNSLQSKAFSGQL